MDTIADVMVTQQHHRKELNDLAQRIIWIEEQLQEDVARNLQVRVREEHRDLIISDSKGVITNFSIPLTKKQLKFILIAFPGLRRI